ncbi:hypothetical protein BER93_04900 [Xanthomonas fragariae]|nr:hypothetical protein BER92_04900 [Xanthomonas fragariae]AOD19941.1 hypothetical protein BER93_04900 [Xanthomonas fragariae]
MMMNFYATHPTIASVNSYSFSIHSSTIRAEFGLILHLIRRVAFSYPLIFFYKTLTNTCINPAFERNLTLSKKKLSTHELNGANLKFFNKTRGKKIARDAVLTISYGFSCLTTSKFKKLFCKQVTYRLSEIKH